MWIKLVWFFLIAQRIKLCVNWFLPCTTGDVSFKECFGSVILIDVPHLFPSHSGNFESLIQNSLMLWRLSMRFWVCWITLRDLRCSEDVTGALWDTEIQLPLILQILFHINYWKNWSIYSWIRMTRCL